MALAMRILTAFHHGRHTEDTAETFEQVRAEFEAAW
jgi:hypothetical protein